MPYTYVYLAGIHNSGPQHWQRFWQEQQGGLWVEHSNWDEPVASLWLAELTEKADARHLDFDVPRRVVASRNDPYGSVPFAFDASTRWKAGFWELGAKGHINADSGLGAWAEGWQDLQHFLRGIQA